MSVKSTSELRIDDCEGLIVFEIGDARDAEIVA